MERLGQLIYRIHCHYSSGGGDGNSIKFSAKDTTYNDATQSSHGLMTATDKTKLDGLPTGTELENTYADKSSYLKKTDATLTYVSKTGLSTELAHYAKKTDITNMYVYKGSVADASKLPIQHRVSECLWWCRNECSMERYSMGSTRGNLYNHSDHERRA